MSSTRKSDRRSTTSTRIVVAAATAITTSLVLSYFREQVADFVRAVASAMAVLSYIAGSIPGGIYWTVAIGVSAALALRLIAGAVRPTADTDHTTSD